MKKLVILLLITTTMFSACSKENNVESQLVNVMLDYSLFESGSMTRSGDDVYISFYEKYIKTKILTPKTFSLTFNSNNTTMEIIRQGVWDNNDGIELLAGDYNVSGNSGPIFNPAKYPEAYVCDSLYIKFDENITINKNTINIMLKGIYNCYLLLFDATNIYSITVSIDRELRVLPKIDNVYYLFVESDYYATASSPASYLYINITRPDGATVNINVGKLKLEKGRYYYFNDTTSSFDIEPMEKGDLN